MKQVLPLLLLFLSFGVISYSTELNNAKINTCESKPIATLHNSSLSNISAEVTNILCDSNGTNSDPLDDFYTFDIVVTGTNMGSSWIATDPNSTTGQYDSIVSFGPYDTFDNISFIIMDANDPNCQTDLIIINLLSCSPECEITSSATNILCTDSGTPDDPTDRFNGCD